MKRLALAILILLPSFILAAEIYVARLPLERLRPVLERDLGEILGLDVRIEGSIRANLLPWLRLELRRVEVDNLPERPSEHLLAIRHAGLEIRLLPLLQNRIVFEGIEINGVDLRVEPDERGGWALAPSLDALDESDPASAADPIRFEIRRLSVLDLQVYLDPHGASPIRTVHIDELVLAAADRQAPIDLNARGHLEGGAFDLVAELGSPVELRAPTRPFPVRIEADVIDGWVELVGHFEAPGRLGGADLRLEALIMDPAGRARDLGLDLPALGSVELTGRLVERDAKLGIEGLQVRSRGDGPVDLRLGGSVAHLAALESVDLQMELETPDARLFSSLAPFQIPSVPLLASLRLEDRDGELSLDGEVSLDDPGRFAARGFGRVSDLLGTTTFDTQLDLEAVDLTGFVRELGLGHLLPEASLGPVLASGHLVTRGEQLGLERLDVTLGPPERHRAHVEGELRDLRRLKGVGLRGRLISKDLRELAAHFGQAIPAVGGVEATFSLEDSDGTLGLDDVVLELGHEEGFHVSAKGRVGDLANRADIDVETSIFLADLEALAVLLDADLPDLGPFDYAARVRGSLDALRSTGSLRVRDTLFEGEFNRFAREGERARVEFRVHSPIVHLSDLLAPLPSGTRGRIRPRIRREFDLVEWWEGKGRLPLDGLRAVDAEIRLDADRLVGTELLEVQDLLLDARLENGLLRIDEAVARYEEGGISARLDVDARESQPRFSASLEAFNVDMTRLMRQFREETDYAGLLDLSIELSTSGATQREFRSNLDGRFGGMLRDGALVGDYARSFTFDVLRVSIPSLSFGRDEEAPVQCLLMLFPIEGGMATLDTLYIEGRDVTISGTGKMDLVRDAYDLRLTPELHKPGLVSVAATVQVAGPLDDPVFQPLKGSMVTSAMRALLDNSLRPIKALERLVRWRGREGDEEEGGPCDAVVRHRVRQMESPDVEPIDLEEVVSRLVAEEGSGNARNAPPTPRRP